MSQSLRPGSIVFGLAVGLLVALLSYQWITDPDKRAERERQERVVQASRALLGTALAIQGLEVVDPLAPQRKVGKVYVYPAPGGWEVSGYYRRDEDDGWHPYLMILDSELALTALKVQDADAYLQRRARTDDRLTVIP